MPSNESRVAVYIDFDNVVISRASQVKDTDASATVAIDVLLDFAARYGRLTIARAYADWSVQKNADYRQQLVARAVELVHLFPASGTKNGADIRLAVDAIEDLYLHDDLTHVLIAAGDSDFVPLAQRARRLGRTVLGVGVAGSISRALANACDVYVDYDTLLADRHVLEQVRDEEAPRSTDSAPKDTTATATKKAVAKKAAAKKAPAQQEPLKQEPLKQEPPQQSSPSPRRAFPLLVEALRGLSAQDPQAEWHAMSLLKNQVLRMYPAFKESDYDAASFGKLSPATPDTSR